MLRTRRLLAGTVDDKIFLHHIPKCGGTSVHAAIRDSYGHRKSGHISLDVSASVQGAELAGEPLPSYCRKLLLYYMSRRHSRFISGHFRYSAAAMEAFGSEWHFVTVLRHPVDRWFSHYFYDRYKRSSNFRRIEEPLLSFLETPTARNLGRTYISFLTENAPSGVEEASSQAIENLSKYHLVGITERMDHFVQAFEHCFDARLFINHKKRSPLSATRQKEMVTAEIRERVQELCAPDLKVYKAAAAGIQRGILA